MQVRTFCLSCCIALTAALGACASTPKAVELKRPVAISQSGSAKPVITLEQFWKEIEDVRQRLALLDESIVSVNKLDWSIVCGCSPSVGPNKPPLPPILIDQALSALELVNEASAKNQAVSVQSR